ncbi:inositol monophosphatase family protein [Martelella radicis]|uniref:Inositol-1-monophosphatase n=1 Tax=Martelella radicis TaxID=1397476 RepID=A0A7W6KHP0_9HYPH|nr:inositol monophosphatase [Martelella radicis]MBB4121275.1 myo-inositol-1(or 4)-monophosphatase [Martelella radicis]
MTTSSSPARAARLAAAKIIIREAGALALDFFRRRESLIVETKTSGQDLVSVADRSVEGFIRAEIAARFPEDGLLGEEHGKADGKSGFCWIIDPIDGTSPFLHGLESWSVVIAIAEGDRTVLSLIAHPATGALYWAEEGHGAWCDNKQLSIDAATPFSGGVIAIGPGGAVHARAVGRIIANILEDGGSFMRNGSAALSLAHVAQGSYLGFYEPELSAWDCVAGLLLVREAGGIAIDPFAGDLTAMRRPCLAAAPQVAERLKEILQGRT